MRLLGEADVVYSELSALLPKEAIQKADKMETKKGYSTTGYSSQYIVNRMNEVLGIDGWNADYKIKATHRGVFASGKPYIDLTVETTITVYLKGTESIVSLTRKAIGGHVSSVYEDAFKGANTNSFKKAAALFGIGNQAYLGILDDDATYEDEIGKDTPPVTTEATKELLPAKTEPEKPSTADAPPRTEKLSDNVKKLYNIMVGIVGKDKEKLIGLLHYVTGRTSLYEVMEADVPGIIAMIERVFTDCPKGSHPCDDSEWDDMGKILCKKTGKKCFFPEGEKGMVQ